MHRVHVDPDALASPGPVRVEGDEARHAARVRRLRVGAQIGLFDGRGGVRPALLASLDARGRWIECEPTGPAEQRPRPIPHVEVLSPSPKGDRLPAMIDQLSQLGVASWRPLTTSRTVVEPRDAKLDRLRRVAVESAKQCGRAWVIEIGAATTLEDALAQDDAGVLLVCDARGEPSPDPTPERVRVFLGPEGGLSPDELALARSNGASATRLGPHTMRIETAAVAAAAILMRGAADASANRYTNEEAQT